MIQEQLPSSIKKSGIKLLLVDDKPQNLHFLSKLLAEHGYQVQRAISGQLAVNAAIASPPDLILLDLIMPGMDGHEVCRRLKATETTKDIPVIFLSASNEASAKLNAFRAGGVDYITKPFQVEELLARIENQLTIQTLQKQLRDKMQRLQQEISERQRAEAALVERITLAALEAEVGIGLTQEKNLQDMLSRCTSALFQHLNAVLVCIWTLNEQENLLELQASAGMDVPFKDTHQRVRVGQCSIGLIAKNCRPYIVLGRGSGEGGMGNEAECSMSNWGEGIDSFAGYPLVIENSLVGVMAVFARHRLTEVTLQAIASIANGIALGIDRFWGEEELRKSEERWQLALKGNNDGIWDWNLKTGESFISLRNKQILGYEDHEMANPIHVDAWTSHIHPDDLGSARMAMQDHLSHKTPYYSVEYRLRCKDGAYKWILSRGQALWDKQGQPVRMVGSITDISDRKWAEEKLRASEASLATAQRVAHVGSWEFDVATQKFTWSEENFHIFGLDPTAPAPTYIQLIELVHPDDRGLWRTIFELVLAEGRPYKSDFRIVRPDGEVRYLEGRQEAMVNEYGQVIRLFGTNLDITQRKQVEDALRQSEAREREKAKELELALRELKRTQAQLIHTEKMSSLGQMVAGVAHEINNPVSFIYCNITIARAYVQDLIRLIQTYRQTYPHSSPEIQALVEEIDLAFLMEDWQKLITSMEVGAERIHEIVRSLQIFSRQNESEVKLVDLHENIDNTLLILQHRLRCVGHRSEIQVIKNYGQLPKVNCYASQLNQVFMNLLSNAIDALEQDLVSPKSCPLAAKPTITICTELKTQRQRLPAHLRSPNSAFAVIRIADNGPGMTEEVLRQIFDPFFTTKPVGSGIGLGLSISHQIVVEKHGGQLSCISALGKGTEFIMEIPLQGQLS